jgi:hypothetical protein
MTRLVRYATIAAALIAAAGSPARAQQTFSCTDCPVILPSFYSPMNPGTVPIAVTMAVADALVNAGNELRRTGTVVNPMTGVVVPAQAVQRVIAMMTDATPEVRQSVGDMLRTSGASEAVVRQLMTNLPSLLSNPTPGQMQQALSAFNGLVNNSTAAFLVNPPAEFQAMHSILTSISKAANAVPHPGGGSHSGR